MLGPASRFRCIRWWIKHIPTEFRPITHGKPDAVIESDSSLSGWGGYNVTTTQQAHGEWSNSERADTFPGVESRVSVTKTVL